MPSKHKAGGCNCCGCDCTFELDGCDYSWECPTAVRTVFYGECAGEWVVIADTGSTGTATIKRLREYKLEVYCEDSVTVTRTYNLGVLTTSIACADDCIPNPIADNCECALSDVSKRAIPTCDVTVLGTAATCTACSASVPSHNWDGTYTVDCNDDVVLYKATLIRASCPTNAGNDVYAVERLSIGFVADGSVISVSFNLTAAFNTQGPGAPNPCPTVSTSCPLWPGLQRNSCEWFGSSSTKITWKNCLNYDACENDSTGLKIQCVTSLVGTMTCIPLPPSFANLCNYSGVSVSVAI